MALHRWLARTVLNRLSAPRSPRRRRVSFIPQLEYLEARELLAFDTTISTATTVAVQLVENGSTATFTAVNLGANVNVQDMLTELQKSTITEVVVDTGSGGSGTGNITWQSGANLNYSPISGNKTLLISANSTGTSSNFTLSSSILGSGAVTQSLIVNFDIHGSMTIGGSVNTNGALAQLTSTTGSISENSSGVIQANQLTLSAGTSITMDSNNAVSFLSATGNGNISFTNNANPLTVTSITTHGGNATLDNTGTLVLNNTVALNGGASSGTGSLTVTLGTNSNITIDNTRIVASSATITGTSQPAAGTLSVVNYPVTSTVTFTGPDQGTITNSFISNGINYSNIANVTVQNSQVVLLGSTSVSGSVIVQQNSTMNLATPGGQPVTLQAESAGFQMNGTFQPLLTNSGSSKLQVTDDVTINPTAKLALNVNGMIPLGQTMQIVSSGGFVNGTFAGLPEGAAVIASNGQPFQVHYVADGEVDVTAIILPTATALVAAPTSVLTGQSVTLTATVSVSIPVSSQALQIVGAVAYSIDGGPPQMGTVTSQAGTLVTTMNATLPAGSHQVKAAYTPTGGSFFNPSTSSAVGVSVQTPVVNWTPLPAHIVVTAADAGGQPKVEAFDPTTTIAIDDFFAYDPGMSAGVRVAAADLQGIGTPDIITVPGPGAGAIVRVFDGRTGNVRLQFPAFGTVDNPFTGGAYVAAADVLNQGYDDIIVSADAGGGPAVAVFDGKTGNQVLLFNAFGAGFTGGVRVAAGPYTPGGPAVIFTAAGPGGGPAVSVWSTTDITAGAPEKTFYVIPPDANGNLFTGGVYLGAAPAGDGRDYLVSGAAPGGGPAVTLIDPLNTTGAFGVLVSQPFFFIDPVIVNGVQTVFTGGVRVAGGPGMIVAAAGPGGGPVAKSFPLSGPPAQGIFVASDADNPNLTIGLFVAAT